MSRPSSRFTTHDLEPQQRVRSRRGRRSCRGCSAAPVRSCSARPRHASSTSSVGATYSVPSWRPLGAPCLRGPPRSRLPSAPMPRAGRSPVETTTCLPCAGLHDARNASTASVESHGMNAVQAGSRPASRLSATGQLIPVGAQPARRSAWRARPRTHRGRRCRAIAPSPRPLSTAALEDTSSTKSSKRPSSAFRSSAYVPWTFARKCGAHRSRHSVRRAGPLAPSP